MVKNLNVDQRKPAVKLWKRLLDPTTKQGNRSKWVKVG